MLTKREIIWLIIVIIIFEFMLALGINNNAPTISFERPLKFLVPPLILLTTVITKKIAGKHNSITVEHTLWKIQRHGLPTRAYFKKPFPLGLVLPFFLSFVTMGIIKPLTFLEFRSENLWKKRLLKEYGDYNRRRSLINESDLAFTAAWGFYSLIVLSVIGIILSFRELALYPLYYIYWNMVPWEGLDGIKLFFGSFVNWIIVLVLSIFTLGIALILV